MAYTDYQKQEKAGFDRRGFLLSNLRFTGICRVAEKSERFKRGVDGREDSRYWMIKDEFGAMFSLWEEEIANRLLPGEQYIFEGMVRISRGSTYLNLKEVRAVYGSEFATQWDNEEFCSAFTQRLRKALGEDQKLMDRFYWALEQRSFGTLAEVEKILEQTERSSQEEGF